MKLAFLIAFFLLVIPIAYAAEIEIKTTPIQNSILPEGHAAFDIKITNNQNIRDTFRISYTDIFWDLTSDPLYHYFSGIEINPSSTQTVRLFLNPLGILDFGQYKVDLVVKSVKGENSETFPLFITIRPEKPLIREYLAAVRRIVEIPSVIFPDGNVTVKINLINRNPKNLSDVQVVLSSNLFNRTISTSLAPLETIILEETFFLDPLTMPQEDVLNVKLIVDGSTLEPEINEPFEIGGYSEIIEESSETKNLLLKTITVTTYTNKGNVESSRIVEIETTALRKAFTTSSPESFEITKRGKNFLAWEFSLEPADSIVITSAVSYRSLAVLLLILAAAGALYYLMRSPVYIVKSAGIVSLKDGGLSELKIVIHVKNRSSQNFERLTISDKIPMIAEITLGQTLGTVQPASVYNDGHRTVVKWELDKLDKHEERILSYKIKSKLAILGSVTLPKATIRFYSPKGAKLITRSKSVVVNV